MNNQDTHARKDFVFDQHGTTTFIDVAMRPLSFLVKPRPHFSSRCPARLHGHESQGPICDPFAVGEFLLVVCVCVVHSRFWRLSGVGSHKEMSRAVRVRTPQEAQKAKALWKMKAAKDAGEEYYDSTREVGIKGRNETRSALWKSTSKKTIVALDKALKCVEDQYGRFRSKRWGKDAFPNGR